MKNVFFVCSSALHLKLFAPTIRLLVQSKQLNPIVVSLDLFYEGIHGNVASCAAELKLPVKIIDAGFKRGTGLLTHIYAARGAGLPTLQNIFNQGEAKLVVLGNDTGHAERAALHAAKSLHIPTMLVQDGFLVDHFAPGFFGSLQLTLRKLWLKLGGNQLGGVPYGMGGCDVIATYSNRWLNKLHREKQRATKRIEIIGHPALHKTDNSLITPIASHDICYFCTNFLSGLKDAAAHQEQINAILTLRKLLTTRYGAHATLHIKLHPADQLKDYAELIDLSGIVLHKETGLSELIQRSWLCMTNISSVLIDCISGGRVCLMSGVGLQNRNYRRLFASLPGAKFSAWGEFFVWLDQLDAVNGYQRVLDMQRQELDSWVGEAGQGGTRLAVLIEELSNVSEIKANA